MSIKDQELPKFFYDMYEQFGQWAVINFVKDRQDNKQLSQVSWDNCGGCEEYTPVLDKACLICGEQMR